MSKSLAELRASKATSLPERSYSLCLAAGLVAEVQALEEERASLVIKQAVDAEGREGAPRRAGESDDPRRAEIDARMAELWDEMEAHTGELHVRAVDQGQWRRWIDANPAREDNKRDEQHAHGMCDLDALIDDLGSYAVSWNGEALESGDWDFIASKASAADLRELAVTVLVMHESVVNLPKWRAVSLVNQRRSNA